jgi:hypothetical protein
MSTSDGAIVGTAKIVDHGPPESRWNLVILGEGYKATELPKYHTDVRNFVTYLEKQAPFNVHWSGINVFRVDVTSTDSGADDPAACGDGTVGSGATPATYFDATFCTNNTRRLLAGDSASALNVAQAQVPRVSATMVIVNSPIYGGAGGTVAWFSTEASAAEIGIHELGHSYFGLTDEYGDIINTFAGSEPAAPNATINTDKATIKWKSLIAAATTVPTMNNPDCTKEDTRPSPVTAGTVGAFEGAARAHCGAFRPEYDCRMRTLGRPSAPSASSASFNC